MAQSISLEVATPLGRALSTDSESVQVPGVAGEFGVLAMHLPILAAVKPGILKYRQNGTEERAAIGGGFAEADATHVRLITEFYATQSDVDLDDAKRDLEAAQERLRTFKGEFGDPEHREAQRDLDWALARIELAS
ncbi:MAG: ATP synthase F1 subunit epsilon [Myxococcales bacterium]|nr:ATP synthase F1 subunit epsilon [Myxococcales bacterium]MDD9970594.1 ATP synthase F1 subunit epsilon [Myxococcales bacterium]